MIDAFRILPDGTVIGLWSDSVRLATLGRVEAWRGSAVQWDSTRQGWLATIFDTGEVLGPFPTRQAAVDAERQRMAALLAPSCASSTNPPTRPTNWPGARARSAPSSSERPRRAPRPQSGPWNGPVKNPQRRAPTRNGAHNRAQGGRMSHVAVIQVELRDRQALATAARAVGATIEEGSVRFYDGTEASGTVIRLPGWQYPVVVDKHNRAHYDNYGGRWGDIGVLHKLRQAYAVEVATRTAQRMGRQIVKQAREDGSIRLEIKL